MKQWLASILIDLKAGKNVDVYFTLAVSIGILLIDVFGRPSTSAVSEATLLVLSVLAYSTLINRRSSEKLEVILADLRRPGGSLEELIRQEYDHSDLERRLRRCEEAFFWGFTFTRTIPLIKDEVEDQLRRGLKVRFLIIEPESEAVRMNAFRKAHRNESTTNGQLYTNLASLADLAQRTRGVPGRLEARCIDQLPPWTLVAFNPREDQDGGHMYVRLSSFRTLNKLRPTFQLTKEREGHLFQFFVEQFESVWNDANPIDLENHTGKPNEATQPYGV